MCVFYVCVVYHGAYSKAFLFLCSIALDICCLHGIMGIFLYTEKFLTDFHAQKSAFKKYKCKLGTILCKHIYVQNMLMLFVSKCW